MTDPLYDKLHDALIDDRNRAIKAHPGQGSWDVADVMAIIWPEIEGLQYDLQTSRERSKHLKDLLKEVDIAAKELNMNLIEMLTDIADSDASEANSVGAVEVLIDGDTWAEVQQWAAARKGKEICPRCQQPIDPGTRHGMFNGNQLFACTVVQER